MILDLSDTSTVTVLGAVALVLILALLLMRLATRLRDLSSMQAGLTSALDRVAKAQADAEARMADSLGGASLRTAQTLADLQARLTVIDDAQTRIETLSGDVLGLQDILSNKQTRGAFGEIQLRDILGKALPPDAYTWQATLPNGRRADCLVHMPDPPGPLVIDAKFPLESYEALVAGAPKAPTQFRAALRTHIRAIADRYILPGTTADGACLFLPSEAIYAELHANFPDVVREGFAARVWIVSPTTCMATLNTLRAILKDHRMREQTGAIRQALGLLGRDVALVVERAAKLETHFDQARRDVDGIAIAAERAGKRAMQLDSFDFQETAAPAVERPAPIIRRG